MGMSTSIHYFQCCGSGSARIGITLPDPFLHPWPANPESAYISTMPLCEADKLLYAFSKNLIKMYKIFRYRTLLLGLTFIDILGIAYETLLIFPGDCIIRVVRKNYEDFSVWAGRSGFERKEFRTRKAKSCSQRIRNLYPSYLTQDHLRPVQCLKVHLPMSPHRSPHSNEILVGRGVGVPWSSPP